MDTPLDVIKWAKRDLSHFCQNLDCIGLETFVQGGEATRETVKLTLYSNKNKYTISAKSHSDQPYLGCVASSRMPRAGEDWTRGSDLTDGPLNEETWHKILADIVSYELVRIHKGQTAGDLPLVQE